MLKNFFKISWRNLVANKAYTFINVSGLALSMACGILIFTLIKYHLSFDDFHPDSGRIYRMVTEQHRDNISYVGSVPPAFAKTFRKDYTFAELTANITTFPDELVTINSGAGLKKFKEPNGISFVEQDYFDIFNFPLLRGDKHTALNELNTGIITERIAKKYFGKEDPMGKIFKLDDKIPVRVTGILKDLPDNTDQKSEVFLSYPTIKAYAGWFVADDAWGGINDGLQCYVRLRPGVTPAQVEAAMPALAAKYRPQNKNIHVYRVQPLREVHFDARYGGVMERRTLWILSFIGIFLIVTACVNFVNLATAQALRRSREVGVRKVLGSLRSQLFWQFIAETALISILGLALALAIAMSVLPSVNSLFKTQMSLHLFSDGTLLFFLLLLTAVVTFLAGSYPGLILSRFKPVAAIKGKISNQQIGGFNTRRALIVTQFAISQILIIGMIVIASQMHYAKSSDLGFNKDAIVMVPLGLDSAGNSVSTLKDRLARLPGVEKVTACYEAPSAASGWGTSVRYDNRVEDEVFHIEVKAGDDQYISTFGIDLVAGRNIFPSDTVREFLVNETFVRKLNLTSPSQVIGKKMAINGDAQKSLIVGVVKDFHNRSLRSDINAVCITTMKRNYQYYAARIDMRNVRPVVAALERTWSQAYPTQIFDYHFLDDRIAALYETETIMLRLIQAFSFIAIFIGCLGLYGLVLFMAAQRTKEIGIRKVLGSSVSQILWIFGSEFARLILIAFVIAAPVAGWLMHNWLQDFKFHIPLNPLFFIGTIGLMAVIAFATVGYQAIRAARMNPARSLKTE